MVKLLAFDGSHLNGQDFGRPGSSRATRRNAGCGSSLCDLASFWASIPKCWIGDLIAPSIFMVLSGYLITRSLEKMRGQSPARACYISRQTPDTPVPPYHAGLGRLSGWRFRDNILWHAGFHECAYGEWVGFLSHLWSLATQEQFYLIWPLILLLPVRYLLPTLLLAYAGAALFRAWCLHTGASDLFRWFMLPGSLDTFAAGGLVAWAQKARGTEIIPRKLRIPAAALAIGCWVISRHLRELNGAGHLALALVETFETVLSPGYLRAPQYGKGAVSTAFPLTAGSNWTHQLRTIHLAHDRAHALTPHFSRRLNQHAVIRCAILTLASLGVASLS
jgi:hypothetical protein